MLVVASPLRVFLDRLVMSKLFRRLIRRGASWVNAKDLEFSDAFLTLRNRCRAESQSLAVGGDCDIFNVPGSPGHRPGARRGIGRVVRVVSWSCSKRLGPRHRSGQVNAENRVSTLTIAVADHIFPVFLIRVFLFFGQWLTSCVVERVGINGPGEGVDLLFGRGNRNSLAAGWRNDVELRSIILRIGVVRVIRGTGQFPIG